MNNEINTAKLLYVTAASSFGIVFTKIFGEWNDNILALIILMCIDFITGLIVAALFQKSSKTESGGLSSKVCLQGIAKKAAEMMLVAVAYQSDRLLSVDYIRIAVIWGLCAAEIISIMENARDMGILPDSVQSILNKVVDSLNKNDKTAKKRTRKRKDDNDDENE